MKWTIPASRMSTNYNCVLSARYMYSKIRDTVLVPCAPARGVLLPERKWAVV